MLPSDALLPAHPPAAHPPADRRPLSFQSDRSSYPVNHIAHRFGSRLRDLRKANHLTQSRMAAEFGIDRSFISDLERGQKAVCLPLLDVLARGLHLSLSDLLHDL